MGRRHGRTYAAAGALVALLAASLALWVAAPRSAPQGDVITVPLATEPHAVGIWTGRSYAYIIPDAAGATLIDAGSDPTAHALLQGLARLHLRADQVRAVLLTHGHRDHRAGVGVFAQAAIYVQKRDIGLARNTERPRAPGVWLSTRLRRNPPIADGLQTILPGARLKLGPRTFEVVALPGHTPGSSAFVTEGVAFVGDALRLDHGPRAVWPWGLSESPATSRRALERLDDVTFTVLADGHFGILTAKAR